MGVILTDSVKNSISSLFRKAWLLNMLSTAKNDMDRLRKGNKPGEVNFDLRLFFFLFFLFCFFCFVFFLFFFFVFCFYFFLFCFVLFFTSLSSYVPQAIFDTSMENSCQTTTLGSPYPSGCVWCMNDTVKYSCYMAIWCKELYNM